MVSQKYKRILAAKHMKKENQALRKLCKMTK